MKNMIRKTMAVLLCTAILVPSLPLEALAATVLYSNRVTFRNITLKPKATATPVPTPEPAPEPTATPAPTAPAVTWERNEDGTLVLDEQGNPIAIIPEGLTAPVALARDGKGNLILDDAGNPIVLEVLSDDEPEEIPEEEPEIEPEENLGEEPETEPEEKQGGEDELPTAPLINYERDANGTLLLDEKGNPIALIGADEDIPVEFLRDDNGALALDDNGNPIPTRFIPAGSMLLLDETDPEWDIRSVTVYIDQHGEAQLHIGDPVTLHAVLNGYGKVTYTLQWQWSPDNENWNDVPGETGLSMDFTLTMDNYRNWWRVSVNWTSEPEK